MKNIAIIGFGKIAVKHIEVFKALGCNIVASANRSEEKRAEASSIGIPSTYSDYHEMIKSEKIDGLLVCVSYWSMFDVLKEVIPYGIPVLAEKPTGNSLAEHLHLKELALKHDTSVMVGLNRRHYSIVLQALSQIKQDGGATTVLVEWSEDPHHLKVNRKLTDSQISKQLFGNTIHGLDLLHLFAGDIENPFVICSKSPNTFDWRMNISGKSNDGVIFNFNSSWDNPVPWRVVVYTKDKRYLFAPLEQCEVTHKKEKSLLPVADEDISYKAGFLNQAKAFINQQTNDYDLASVDNSMKLAELLSVNLS